MKRFFKNKAVSVIILLATLVLAGIAVFTAIRLYQLRQESVAPSAPTSEPQAVGSSGGSASLNQCTPLTFTIETTGAPATGCTLSANPASLSMKVGEKRTSLITITGNPGNLNLNARDTSIVDVNTGSPVSCFLPPCPVNVEVTALKVGSTIVDIAGTPSGSAQTCQVPVTVTVLAPGQTPPPSIVPSPSPSPSGSPLALTSPSPSPTASPTSPASCNNSCNTSSDCQSGLVCSNGSCKNAACAADTDCICATSTPPPSGIATEPDGSIPSPVGGSSAPIAGGSPTPGLPDAGVSTPTIISIGFGILLILGALLLAL